MSKKIQHFTLELDSESLLDAFNATLDDLYWPGYAERYAQDYPEAYNALFETFKNEHHG